MPLSKKPFDLVSVHHCDEDHDYCNTSENEESHILMVPYVRTTECEKDRAEKSARPADDKKFHCGQVPQSKDIAEVVFRKAWYEKKEEDQESTLVMEEIIKALHHLLVHKLVYKRSSKRTGEGKRDIRTDGEANGGEDHADNGTVKEASQESRDFTRYGCCDYLCHLQGDKGEKTKGTKRINKGPHPFFAGKEFLDLDENMD